MCGLLRIVGIFIWLFYVNLDFKKKRDKCFWGHKFCIWARHCPFHLNTFQYINYSKRICNCLQKCQKLNSVNYISTKPVSYRGNLKNRIPWKLFGLRGIKVLFEKNLKSFRSKTNIKIQDFTAQRPLATVMNTVGNVIRLVLCFDYYFYSTQ